jgi:hypothetical protein
MYSGLPAPLGLSGGLLALLWGMNGHTDALLMFSRAIAAGSFFRSSAKIRALLQKNPFMPERGLLMSDFKRPHFQGEVILWAVRWYCRYGVSYDDLEQMMGERA